MTEHFINLTLIFSAWYSYVSLKMNSVQTCANLVILSLFLHGAHAVYMNNPKNGMRTIVAGLTYGSFYYVLNFSSPNIFNGGVGLTSLVNQGVYGLFFVLFVMRYISAMIFTSEYINEYWDTLAIRRLIDKPDQARYEYEHYQSQTGFNIFVARQLLDIERIHAKPLLFCCAMLF